MSTLDNSYFTVPYYYRDNQGIYTGSQANINATDILTLGQNMNFLFSNFSTTIPYGQIFTSYATAAAKNYQTYISRYAAETYNSYLNFKMNSIQTQKIDFDMQVSSSVRGVINFQGLICTPGTKNYSYNEPNNDTTFEGDVKEEFIVFSLSSSAGSPSPITPQILTSGRMNTPRAYLNPTLQTYEDGINLTSLKIGSAIYDAGTKQNASLIAINRLANKMHEKVLRQKSLFAFASSYGFGATNPTTYDPSIISQIHFTTTTISETDPNSFYLTPEPPVFATSTSSTDLYHDVEVRAFVGTSDAPARFEISCSLFDNTYSSVAWDITGTNLQWITGTLRVPTDLWLTPEYRDLNALAAGSGSLVFRGKVATGLFGDALSAYTVQLFEKGMS